RHAAGVFRTRARDAPDSRPRPGGPRHAPAPGAAAGRRVRRDDAGAARDDRLSRRARQHPHRHGRAGVTGPPASDPITLELIKNARRATVDERAIALVRTAYWNNLKNSMDMWCALCDAEGRLIAQGLTLPLHLGSVPDAMAAVKRKFHGKVRPGDVFILNDPFEG